MVFRNTVALTAAYVIGYALSFVLAPIMLARLGLDLFGVWAVTGGVAAYAGLADLGITRSMERFVAVFYARGDQRKVEECFALAIIAVTIVGALATLVAVVAAPFVDSALGGPLGTSDMRLVLVASALTFAFHAYRSVLNSVPEGMQQMVQPAIGTIVYSILNFAVSLAALLASRDLAVYAWATAGSALAGVLIALVPLRLVWGRMPVRLPSRALVREVLAYSVKGQIGVIADLVNYQTDKILIGLLIDVRAAGAYEIANRAVLAVRTIGMMGTSAILSAASAAIAGEGRHVIPRFYSYYTARSTAVSLPLMVLSAVAAPALLILWIGDNLPSESLPIFVALTLANAFNLTSGVASNIMLGEGKAGVVSAYAVAAAVINIALTVILTPLFEMTGVIAATVISLVLSTGLLLLHFHRAHRIALGEYGRAVAWPALLSAVAAAPCLLWLALMGAPDGRPAALLVCAVMTAVFGSTYWVAATWLDLLPERLRLPLVRRTPSVPA